MSGNKLNVIGCIRLYDQLFIVTEDHTTPGDILIGYDFMTRRGMILDMGNNVAILDWDAYELDEGRTNTNMTSQHLRIELGEMRTEFNKIKEIGTILERHRNMAPLNNSNRRNKKHLNGTVGPCDDKGKQSQ